MRTLIFGAKGQLGRDLMRVFGEIGNVNGFDLPELDIADSAAVKAIIKDISPEVVLNAAAYTNVEAAEDDEQAAFTANEMGARNVAQAANDIGAPVVYFSTDYVFDGSKSTPYVEEDTVAPLCVYAQSKEAGERATREGNSRQFILRTAWLYGPGGMSFPEKILKAAAERPALKVVDDEIGSPTHTLDLAEATFALVSTEAYGTYHAVNSGHCSRFEFASQILKLGGLDTPIAPCESSEFPTKAKRPLRAVLSTAKLTSECGYQFPPWDVALKVYMERRKKPEIKVCER